MARRIAHHVFHACMFCASSVIASAHHETVAHVVRTTVDGALYGLAGVFFGGTH